MRVREFGEERESETAGSLCECVSESGERVRRESERRETNDRRERDESERSERERESWSDRGARKDRTETKRV